MKNIVISLILALVLTTTPCFAFFVPEPNVEKGANVGYVYDDSKVDLKGTTTVTFSSSPEFGSVEGGFSASYDSSKMKAKRNVALVRVGSGRISGNIVFGSSKLSIEDTLKPTVYDPVETHGLVFGTDSVFGLGSTLQLMQLFNNTLVVYLDGMWIRQKNSFKDFLVNGESLSDTLQYDFETPVDVSINGNTKIEQWQIGGLLKLTKGIFSFIAGIYYYDLSAVSSGEVKLTEGGAFVGKYDYTAKRKEKSNLMEVVGAKLDIPLSKKKGWHIVVSGQGRFGAEKGWGASVALCKKW